MSKSIKANWKLYGLTLFGLCIIPCYNDVVRILKKQVRKRKLKSINTAYLKASFQAKFDTDVNLNEYKKYVVLEHLNLPHLGSRFWSTNTNDNTMLHDGTVAYKEILFTDSETEAIAACK